MYECLNKDLIEFVSRIIPFGFDIFSSPLEIHRHFQKDMEEISRLFETFGNMFGKCLHRIFFKFSF
jgi:hypothetical protein